MIATQPEQPCPPAYFAALDHEAPYLLEKLIKERIVDTVAEGEAVFREMKRFIVLVHADTSTLWDMYSRRIDEVWHQFVLFTREYIDFCVQYFGIYVHHSPSNAPSYDIKPDPDDQRKTSTFGDFAARYREMFGEALPPVWFDENSVAPHRRVLNDLAGKLTLREDGDLITLVDAGGIDVVSINDLARDALAFIARTGAFYVRELPGDLTDEEKVALVATLVEHRILRVGS